MCGSQCGELGPPPNSILSMPPPPLPSFLVPRTAIFALPQNDSQPCIAAFVCESTSGTRELSGGIEFIELPGSSFDDAWLFLLVAAVVTIIIVVTVLSFMVMKCREYVSIIQKFRQRQRLTEVFFHFSCRESVQKRGPVNGTCINEPHVSHDKSQSFLPGDIMYPCASNEQAVRQQMVKENRLLWAALTPRGTRHFVASAEQIPNFDDHYEVVDYQGNRVMRPREGGTFRINPNRSFDNTGFTDFDYEDIMNRTDSFIHDDRDSGLGDQEPHEVISTLNRNSPRPVVSTPTRIEHPNIPPLNMHPHPHSHRGHSSGGTLTPQKKSTLGRRTSDTINMYGSANIWIRIRNGDVLSSSATHFLIK